MNSNQCGKLKILSVNGKTLRFRWIPPGRFMMGSPETEKGRYDDEGPQHQVTISQGFWLAETPCTQAIWESVMDNNPSFYKGLGRPVERVSWNDVQEFIDKLNLLVPDFGFSLPTEAQWEYACRAGTTTAIYADDLNAIAWYRANSISQTHPVGLKEPNDWGLYDMLGNVGEWCQDGLRPYIAEPVVDPKETPDESGARVLRGGSWYNLPLWLRSAYRSNDGPDYRLNSVGFRLLMMGY